VATTKRRLRAMATSDLAQFRATDDRWQLVLPVAPVPKARPKVSKWGTYYPKRTKQWMYDAAAAMASLDAYFPVSAPMFVLCVAVCHKPKNPANDFPVGDVDNFAKGILDAVTKEQIIWQDDKQVVVLIAGKRYADEDEVPHTYLEATTELSRLDWGALWVTPHVSEDALDQEDTISLEEFTT